MIFVNSMSHLFHKHIQFSYVDSVFETMKQVDHHVFQVLTKRSSRLRSYFNSRYVGCQAPQHIWLGVSIEDGSRLSRLRHFQETQAFIRFLFIEPLVGPFGCLDLDGIHWIIVGGESGPRARPIDSEWIRDIKNSAAQGMSQFSLRRARDVAIFFKKWGGKRQKSGGRKFNGREWNKVSCVTESKAKSEVNKVLVPAE